jgi:hypothetical protein
LSFIAGEFAAHGHKTVFVAMVAVLVLGWLAAAIAHRAI